MKIYKLYLKILLGCLLVPFQQGIKVKKNTILGSQYSHSCIPHLLWSSLKRIVSTEDSSGGGSVVSGISSLVTAAFEFSCRLYDIHFAP
jgi:hypothetical protein